MGHVEIISAIARINKYYPITELRKELTTSNKTLLYTDVYLRIPTYHLRFKQHKTTHAQLTSYSVSVENYYTFNI